ncbi:protein regulator of cytokinesis 1-like [Maniola hyperantus]|uniref:protein regulator of cytokinesis 1-like n=1 Tax=Aphantopus hyperantus TaxID=2795564 RepID=UPI0015693AFE|nr:protein regulator of cytokinesis 1-like [Maniola hyperantus]
MIQPKMIVTNDENIIQLFNEVHQDISENVRSLMNELWSNWSHLGVLEEIKITNMRTLVEFEKNFHKEIIFETENKLKQLEKKIAKLKEETEELSRCLSVDITILEFEEDMALIDYKNALEEQLSVYRIQAEQRRRKMDRLLEWQRDLVDKLGVTMHELQEEPLPAEEELDKLMSHLEVLQAERDKRVELFLNTQVEIKDIMAKLQIKPQNKFEQMAVSSMSVDFKVTDQNMDRLAMLRQDLEEKYEQTNNRVLELRERLTRLWDCLEEDQVYRENFLQAHTGCHPQTEMAIKEEIKRCDQIKRQKISVFVANVRTKIKLMWDNLMYSQDQRDEFVHYYQDIFTEDTLTLHELYLMKISKLYEETKHIFELVGTRKELWLKMTELEARASEKGRYQNRGGQLLQEEKERKTIANKLPKIEQQIRDLVLKYEDKTETVFTVDGKPLLQLIQDEWETRKAERQNKLSARKQAQALTPTPQLLRSLATSPLGKRNRTAAGLAGLAATAERYKPPSKRQHITSSATKAMNAVSSNLSAFKRTAVSTVKRRISGRLAAKALVDNKTERAKRKLDYDGPSNKKTPQPKANGSILKHKRTSRGRRSSTTASSSRDTERSDKNPLQDSTMMTTYTDFKDIINDRQASRSSMANQPKNHLNIPAVAVYETCVEQSETPNKLRTKQPLTPKIGKENFQHMNLPMTPKSNLFTTPTRLTRSALRLNNDGFATPRAPLSCSKMNVHRQTPGSNMTLKVTPNGMGRSNSHLNLMRTKNLPPIM